MIHEIYTDEYVIYTVVARKPKTDNYSKKKIMKDRIKLSRWLKTLLQHCEVMIIYDDNGVEKIEVGTLVKGFAEFPDAPLETITIMNKTKLLFNYCRFYTVPKLEPRSVHLDKIKKFIVKNDNVTELSNKVSFIV